MNSNTVNTKIGNINLMKTNYSNFQTSTYDAQEYEKIDYNEKTPTKLDIYKDELNSLIEFEKILREQKEELENRNELARNQLKYTGINDKNQMLKIYENNIDEQISHILGTSSQSITPNRETYNNYLNNCQKQYFVNGELKNYFLNDYQKFTTGSKIDSFEGILNNNNLVNQKNLLDLNNNLDNQNNLLGINNNILGNQNNFELSNDDFVYSKIWNLHLEAGDNSLIELAQSLAEKKGIKDCDEFTIWKEYIKKQNIFDFFYSLSPEDQYRDMQIYHTYMSSATQRNDLMKELAYTSEEIVNIDLLLKQVNETIKLYPYKKIMETDEYKNYVKYFDSEAMSKIDEMGLPEYKYITEEERIMYHYLQYKKGSAEAKKYLEVLQDEINKNKGAEEALKFINSLDLDDNGDLEDSLCNFFEVGEQGLKDGVENFFSGLANLIDNDRDLSVSDYKKMIVYQYITEHTNYKYLINYKTEYEFTSALGNMVPAITASIIVGFIATPAAGEITGSTLMGLSAGGNAKHQALVSGNDTVSSLLYGLFVGLSEASLGYFLGSIPGISKISGFTFSEILKEGVEEFSQEWVDAGLRAVLLNEEINLENIVDDSINSFFMGVMMSAFLNGGKSLIQLSIGGKTLEIDVEKTMQYIKENPTISISDAIEQANPFFKEFFARRKIKEIPKRNFKKFFDGYFALEKNSPEIACYNILNRLDSVFDVDEHRFACDELIKYCQKKFNYNQEQAANLIMKGLTQVIEKRGFNSKVINIEGQDVEIWYQNNYNAPRCQYNESVIKEELSKLPKEFAQLVKQVVFYDKCNSADYYWEIAYKMKGFRSTATGANGVINFFGSSMREIRTIPHEIGHTYDTVYASTWDPSISKISTSQIWLDAIKADKAANGYDSVTEYGKVSPVEDFAESVSLFYKNPEVLDYFPNRKRLLEAHLPKAN